ncbi:MAG: ABC transporter substrate-binding protein [Pseudoxanthomonas sp.]
MTRSILSLALGAALLLGVPSLALAQGAPAAAASATSASKIVQDSSTRILSTLETRRAEFRGNPAALKQFVTTEFNRAFDKDYAARLVLGVHGRGASDADVVAFANALSDNLMSRYGQSLLDFNTKLQTKVLGETSLPNNKGKRVSTQMLRQGGEPIPVDYLLREVNGQWKIFDVMIEGISYVQTFKTQFDAPLRQKTIAQVTDDLRNGRMQANGGAGGQR